MIEALRRSQARDGLIKAIVGHSEAGMTSRYGAGGYEISAMAEALERAQASLGDVHQHVYTPMELGAAQGT